MQYIHSQAIRLRGIPGVWDVFGRGWMTLVEVFSGSVDPYSKAGG